MQLIVDTEPALDIKREMSTLADNHAEDVTNGDIEQLIGETYNGNKQNVGEATVITNDDENLPINVKLENTEAESNIEVAVKNNTCGGKIPEMNGIIKEEYQNNGTDEEIQNKSPIENDSEDKLDETVQTDIAEEESVKVEPETDETEICEVLPATEDNVEVRENPAEIHTTSETIPDVVMDEPVPDVKIEKQTNTINNEDNLSECSDNKEKKIDDIQPTTSKAKDKPSAPVSSIQPILCKLSNTLDILSDDEEEPPKEETPTPQIEDLNEKNCINIEDDDDIMLIDEDTNKTETPQPVDTSKNEDAAIETEDKTDSETGEVKHDEAIDLYTQTDKTDESQPKIKDDSLQINVSEKQQEHTDHFPPELPLLPENFLKSAKKNLADMTREELEEFCILKIVESIVDRSNLSEIKNKLKTVAQGIEEYRKKAMMLTKQNRDLQVVLKSVQEEQKKTPPGIPIIPLKITRSVGMQVVMEKPVAPRRKNLALLQNSNNTRQTTKSLPGTNPRLQKPPASSQPIPVPRLVPASPVMKSPSTIPLVNQIAPSKPAAPLPNGMKVPSPTQKVGDKRQHVNRAMSVTVDLTDDEPPAKINNRTSPAPPVRVIPSQNLMANPRQPFPAPVSSPRKVYIPISGPQNQNMRPGQTIMLKTVPTPGLRPRGPSPQVVRQPTGSVRMNRALPSRHPAPLPDAMKQYQPPNWKALPPAPDLKLSKVENGIVISWKIEGYQEDSYEEIASYQLYAYQETSNPPSTSLWKKIGDVKALPLPMACTLTQFMAGFKYFFAVRAVDIRSRLGPFSCPGSILLLNKL